MYLEPLVLGAPTIDRVTLLPGVEREARLRSSVPSLLELRRALLDGLLQQEFVLEVMLKLLLLGLQLLELVTLCGVRVDPVGQLALFVVVCDELLPGIRGVAMAARGLNFDRSVPGQGLKMVVH